MKRDLDLIRTILLDIEECQSYVGYNMCNDFIKWQQSCPEGILEINREEYTLYQIMQIQESGFFIKSCVCIARMNSGKIAYNFGVFEGLSPKGHDFLQQIKDEKRFVNKIKPVISKLGGWTFDNIFDISRAIDKIDIPNIVSKMFG